MTHIRNNFNSSREWGGYEGTRKWLETMRARPEYFLMLNNLRQETARTKHVAASSFDKMSSEPPKHTHIEFTAEEQTRRAQVAWRLQVEAAQADRAAAEADSHAKAKALAEREARRQKSTRRERRAAKQQAA